jgi:hypothetical protein
MGVCAGVTSAIVRSGLITCAADGFYDSHGFSFVDVHNSRRSLPMRASNTTMVLSVRAVQFSFLQNVHEFVPYHNRFGYFT